MNAPYRILIVEDEPNVRLVFRTALDSSDHVIVEVEDGLAALETIVKSPPFDVILLDLQMPAGLDGMEALRRLRARGDATPVVVVTAHGSVPHAVEAMKLGAIDFLSKPLTPETLRRVVAEVCARGRMVAKPAAEGNAARTPAEQFVIDLNRAKLAINRRDFAAAETQLKRALAIKDDSPDAHNLLGVLMEVRGDGKAAYDSYRHALMIEPKYEPARHNMTRYYQRYTFGSSDVPVDVGD